MILVRQVFHAKYGRGDELVALFKQVLQQLPGTRGRLLTDLSGQFFTLVVELEAASLGEWEKGFGEAMRDQSMGEIFGKTIDLIDSGHREFYTIVS
jgi:hypothetical protein